MNVKVSLSDRANIGGWQLMYQMLQKGQWQIAGTCPKLIEAVFLLTSIITTGDGLDTEGR
jgi:hypothetical protein